jgi:exonuclease SbcC
MKLLNLRLHPFAGIVDRTITLHGGLNVLEGPNEYGKSTAIHALWHALHTPTHLTPVKMTRVIGRWYPQPGGDHARLTLGFEAEGRRWTLEKTWGAGGNSRLQGEGVPAVADADGVQEKLAELLRLNEATWRHVLFTNQAELAQTVDALRHGASSLDDVHGLLAGAAVIPGDIPADRLLGTVVQRVDSHFGRWDAQINGPTAGRGINNPWRNGAGPVLEAYYGQEGVRSVLEGVVRHEKELDAVHNRIRALSTRLANDAEFVKQGKLLRHGLSQRGMLEEKIARLSTEETNLMSIMTAWPGADQVIKAREDEQTRLGESLQRLDAEIGNARKHAAAVTLRKGHQRLTDAQVALEESQRRLAAVKAVPVESLQELRQVEQRITQQNIQIAAQKLAAKIESVDLRTVTMPRGSEALETIPFRAGEKWEGEAAGRITVEANGLRVTVQSGHEDVDALFAKLLAAIARQNELLEALGHESLTAAESAAKSREEMAREVKTREQLHAGALQGKSLEQWSAEMAELATLPATRDLAVLEQERDGLVNQRSQLNAAGNQEREKVMRWSREYTDISTLMTKVIAAKTELQQSQQALGSLPSLPDGYRTVAAYLLDLDARERSHEDLKEQLNTANVERSRLEAVTPERSAEDLRAELELKQREFQRQLAEGHALLRIRAKLEGIIVQQGSADPLQRLREAVSRHFQSLTDGRYTEVKIEGSAPVEVNGTVRLTTKLLSQGTLSSLALATRLALAELYLRDDDGFIVLDDPFTDMDPGRREAAAKALGIFARRCQVLFLTCHPLHREELERTAEAEVVMVG